MRRRLVYHRRVIPPPERLTQLARLIGLDAFVERFGAPQTAQPADDDLRALVAKRLDHIAQALVEEAAASDDVIDGPSAQAYLEDRLRTLGDVLTEQQAEQLHSAFSTKTSEW